jgi:hypothetical protein
MVAFFLLLRSYALIAIPVAISVRMPIATVTVIPVRPTIDVGPTIVAAVIRRAYAEAKPRSV